MLWLLTAVVALVALTQAVCFVIALYEMLNLPEVRDTRLTLLSLVGAGRDLLLEIAAMTAVVLTSPLGFLPWRSMSRVAPSDRPAIVFVPGYCSTRACFWLLRWRLAHAGWTTTYGYNYRTVAGDVRTVARGLGILLDEVCTASDDPRVVVVAHGIGGIVARLCLRERGGRGIGTLVTLGTPHQGSKLYALALDPMLAALRPASPLMEELAAGNALVEHTDVTAIAASFDVTILPSAAGRYPGASAIEIEGVGHFGLLWSPRVFALIRENLEFAEATRGATQQHGGQSAVSAATHRATSSAFE